MFGKLLHNRWLRLCVGVLGTLLSSAAINLFIVPQNLYTGGLLGFCQLIRTVATQKLGLDMGFDFSGILYLLLNIPLLWMAWKNLGHSFVLRTVVCTVSSSLFLTLIPVPAEPIIQDMLTSCLLGGIVNGFAGGLILTCACSSGGLDILGLYLSKKGKGFNIAMATLDGGRIGIAAQALGLGEGAVEEAIKYTKERVQFGKRISQFQNTQFQLADMHTRMQAAQYLVYSAAMKKAEHAKNPKVSYSMDAAMAKLFAAEAASDVTRRAVQLFGGYGYTREYPVERMMRDAKITEIYEGTSEVQRMVIASNLGVK